MEYTAPRFFPPYEMAMDMTKTQLTPQMEQAVEAAVAHVNAMNSVPPQKASLMEKILWKVDQHMRDPAVQEKLRLQRKADREAIDRGEDPFAVSDQPSISPQHTVPVRKDGIRARLMCLYKCIFL